MRGTHRNAGKSERKGQSQNQRLCYIMFGSASQPNHQPAIQLASQPTTKPVKSAIQLHSKHPSQPANNPASLLANQQARLPPSPISLKQVHKFKIENRSAPATWPSSYPRPRAGMVARFAISDGSATAVFNV